jgi:hypothetical protein
LTWCWQVWCNKASRETRRKELRLSQPLKLWNISDTAGAVYKRWGIPVTNPVSMLKRINFVIRAWVCRNPVSFTKSWIQLRWNQPHRDDDSQRKSYKQLWWDRSMQSLWATPRQ